MPKIGCQFPTSNPQHDMAIELDLGGIFDGAGCAFDKNCRRRKAQQPVNYPTNTVQPTGSSAVVKIVFGFIIAGAIAAGIYLLNQKTQKT